MNLCSPLQEALAASQSPLAGRGAAIRWLQQHVSYDGADCLMWPFMLINGYGQFGFAGKRYYAHRIMCEFVNGPPPSPDHEAAHSCGQGHCGCVHPKHLSWKTPSGNQLDRASHGTKNTWGRRGKITIEQAEQIRALDGKMKQADIAKMFGISRSNVSFILLGKAWNSLPKCVSYRKDRQLWRVRLCGKNGRIRYVEFFETEDEAKAAYTQKVEEFRIRDLNSVDD